jgi:hypothetical protein
MRKIKWLLLLAVAYPSSLLKAQSRVDSIKFFKDESPFEMMLTTDIKNLQTEKNIDAYQDAVVNCRFSDSTVIEESIKVCARGHFRRQYCNIPPLMLNFHNPGSPKLNQLGKLKLVIGCGNTSDNEQLVLKEFLCYKIYNLLTEKSFRVRLVKVSYRDTRGKVKPFTQHAFLVEDESELAARNGCMKKPKVELHSEATNRQQMTLVAIFEYLISNGDWSVPANHNIKLIYDKKNPNSPPYPVPYDFDHSGMVNAGYAVPAEQLGTESVTERVYRGFPRTMEELQVTLDIFRKEKNNILSLVNNFSVLSSRTKKELVSYINDFYETIENRKAVQSIFIERARKE